MSCVILGDYQSTINMTIFSLLTGKEHNFNKYEDDFITDMNTPYDYESIMHYRPLSFNKNASIPTITTTIPYFNDVIGQRLDFSPVDITRLNRMYDCGECLRFTPVQPDLSLKSSLKQGKQEARVTLTIPCVDGTDKKVTGREHI